MIVFDRFGKGRRQVDDDVALPEGEIHVGQAFERGLELLDPLLHRHIERGEGARRHRAGGRKAMAQLETLDAFGENIVVRAGCLVGNEIAADQQTLAQQIVMRSRRAEHEFGLGGNHWPAAAHRDIGIAQRRFPDPLRGALVVGRLVR